MYDQDQKQEALQSIQSCIADILRWVLLVALKPGSISADRRRDIINRAQRIIDLAGKL